MVKGPIVLKENVVYKDQMYLGYVSINGLPYGGLIVLGETKIINLIWLGGLVSQLPFRSSLH